jgi:hypothetical protein
MLRGQPEHHTGHNPAGAVAIVAMLLLTAGIAASGWVVYNDLAGEWVAEVHEVLSHGMLLVVGIHVAGVVVASALHGENLARSMVTGRKRGAACRRYSQHLARGGRVAAGGGTRILGAAMEQRASPCRCTKRCHSGGYNQQNRPRRRLTHPPPTTKPLPRAQSHHANPAGRRRPPAW